MTKHKSCAKVRLVDRCVECNPGYRDPHQASWIYREVQRTGASLQDVEEAYIRKFCKS